MSRKDFFSPATATSVVIANMVGTGVFTSLGFQLLDIQSGFVLLMLWVVGGVTACCGALSYAELGATLPRSGGEYNFLGRIYHPAAGFISGWVSSTIGFSAPVALTAITFGTYLASVFPELSPKWLALALILILTFIHASSRHNSGSFQRIFTAIKLLLIILFCLIALIMVKEPTTLSFMPKSGDAALITSGAFAIALIYVNYAYTGWNAATYLSSELEQPQKSLPKVLGYGTLVVMVLYLALNFTFLRVAPVDALSGQLDIGYIAAQHVLGDIGAAIMGIVLALLLISTVSAMILSGPRVLHVIGQDYPLFKLLGKTNKNGVPTMAIYCQSILALLFVVNSSFQQIMIFASFTLGLNTLLAVLGLFVLRWQLPNIERPYKTFGYPVTPIIYITLMGWTLIYTAINKPVEALFALGIIVTGLLMYFISIRFQPIQG